MASVELKTKFVSCVLDLSEEEANTLHDVLGCIGGSESDSRRKYAQAVFDALEEAGVKGDPDDLPKGTMYFNYNADVAPNVW